MNHTSSSAAVIRVTPSPGRVTARFGKARHALLAVALCLASGTRLSAQPLITQQPQNQTNLAGTTATFTVAASGAQPLSYQWRSYTSSGAAFTNIPFATGDRLELSDVQPTTRRFAVVVADPGGLSVTSTPLATLTVLVPPRIAVEPTIQIMTLGGTASFRVIATGTAPLAYQWRFNDLELAGQTGSRLVLANVKSTDVGGYTVVVTNSYGSITSRVAGLAFPTAHRISGISTGPGPAIFLNLEGVVPRLFAPYYDLYPLEVSSNLLDWSPLSTLHRTNGSIDALIFRDPAAADQEQRFYRTPTNFFATPIPPPSGPYPVGTVSRLLTDPSRLRDTTPPTHSFMVTFWYPGEARVGALPDAYVADALTRVPPPNGDPSYWHNPQTVARFVSPARLGLQVAAGQSAFPVLIYSPGYGGIRQQSTDKAVELASHGYVVVAVEHRDDLASVFPDGQVVLGSRQLCFTLEKPCMKPFFEDRMKDLLFVMDELARVDANDPLFAGRLDLERLGAFGLSWGAASAAELCRIDARCKAAVLLSPQQLLETPPELNQFGLQKPFLLVNSATSFLDSPPGFDPDWLASARNLFAKATRDAFMFQIEGSTHASIADRGSIINDPTLTGDPTPASRDISQTLRACVLSFFDNYLKGEDNHLLDNPAGVYRNIINFQKK